MKFVYIIFIGLIVSSCLNTEQTKKMAMTNAIVNKIALDNDCGLTTKILLTEETSDPLVLTLKTNLKYKSIMGKIVFETYEALSKVNIHFDKYIFKASDGGMELSPKELDRIAILKSISEIVFVELVSSEFHSIKNHLHPDYFTDQNIEDLQNNLTGFFKGKPKYVGFELQENENNNYCGFITLCDDQMIMLTFDLKDESNRIYNINIRKNPFLD